MDRLFKQNGQGYGASPVNIIAKIDGNVVFSGEVQTFDEPVPVPFDPAYDYGVGMVTWPMDVFFNGTTTLEIQVTGPQSSVLLLTDTEAQEQPIIDSNGYTNFIYFEANTKMSDPLSDVKIDGLPVIGQLRPLDENGQWYWIIPAGSTLTANLSVNVFNPMANRPTNRYRDKITFNVGEEVSYETNQMVYSFAKGIAPYEFLLVPDTGPVPPNIVGPDYSPTLPAGLTLDSDTGTIVGIPTAVTPNASYHFRLTDYTGAIIDYYNQIEVV